MNPEAKHTARLIWVGLGLTLTLLLLVFALAVLRLSAGKRLPVYGTVGMFALTNQDAVPVTATDLRGHVWVADVIFTRCAGPCLKMSRQMKALQEGLPPSSKARLISLTTDPEYDTPPVLKAYARRFGADPARWEFLTGEKQQIATVVTNSLMLTALEKKPGERETPVDLFIHSTLMVLVDRRGRLRGIFETAGETVDAAATTAEILRGIKTLESER